MKRTIGILFLFAILLLSFLVLKTGCGRVSEAPSQVNNLITAQGVVPEGASLRKIVVFDQTVSAGDQELKVTKHGASVIKPIKLINAQVITLPEQASDKAKAAILKEKGVIRVDDDIIVHALPKPDKPDKPGKPTPPQPLQTTPWGVDRIDADLVTAETGAGVKVAVLDTGIDLSHPDLDVAGGTNIVNPKKSPNDDNGHGTHCAGIIAAVDNEIGVIGVAPGVSLYAVKVLNRSGIGWVSDIILGLEWCVDNKIQVVNMSYGSNSEIPSEHDAITAAYEAGITMVAAAGNDYDKLGLNPVDYPAAYSEVIAVSATDSGDNIAYFSDRGPEIDLAAPGVNINSTVKGSSYTVYSGTSMAAPHVAGCAALVIGAEKASSPDEVRAVLTSSAENIGGPSTYFGAGLVDAEKAAYVPEP